MEGSPQSIKCGKCDYVFAPLETACPRCIVNTKQILPISAPLPKARVSQQALLFSAIACLIVVSITGITILRIMTSDDPVPAKAFTEHTSARPEVVPARSTGISSSPSPPSPSQQDNAVHNRQPPEENISREPNTILPLEPAPRPIQEDGSAHLGDARIKFINDGHGGEIAVGRVLIVNDGPHQLTDFRLGLKVNGLTYALVPFEGNPDNPRPIYSFSRRIPPGGSLDCPVMTTGKYMSYSVYGSKQVTMNAALDGPPGVVSDERGLL